VRRQSIDPSDLFHGHVGAMDLCARALLMAEKMITDGRLANTVSERYAGWDTQIGKDLLGQSMSLEKAAAHALQRNIDERPVSGRQEAYENLVNHYIA
jgi:xylose isomerase